MGFLILVHPIDYAEVVRPIQMTANPLSGRVHRLGDCIGRDPGSVQVSMRSSPKKPSI
jgi:hypothetical protein